MNDGSSIIDMVWACLKQGGKTDTPKWPGKLEHSGREPKKDPDTLVMKGYIRWKERRAE